MPDEPLPKSERKLPLKPVLVLGGSTLVVLMILWLWSEVAEGEVASMDRAILFAFRGTDPNVLIGPCWLRQTMLDITSLGGTTVLTIVITGATIFMVMKGAYRIASLISGATISGALMVSLLKGFFERPRPALVDHLVVEHSASFPSGHASNSAIVYLTIAVLFMRVEPSLRTRLFVLFGAIFLTMSIGVSRIALGVHWPSDVVAGWLFGASWACLWALIVKLPSLASESQVVTA